MIIEDKKTAAQNATSECAESFNSFLQNKLITSVEPGRTRGWVVINFEDVPADKSVRQFMTLWVGTKPLPVPDVEQEHYWEMAIHGHHADGSGGIVYPIAKIEVPPEEADEQGCESDYEVHPADEPHVVEGI
jgi:hypothetical protein